MKIIHLNLIIALLLIVSCTNSENESVPEKSNKKIHTEINNSAEADTIVSILDTFKRIEAEDYPVTNDMFYREANEDKFNRTKSGSTYSPENISWFTNSDLNQSLVFYLYTDYHRMLICHFYNDNIPLNIIERIELHTEDGNIPEINQKVKDFSGFIKSAKKIDAKYFITLNGIKLGDSKESILKSYGVPDITMNINGITQLEWEFPGDAILDENILSNPKPLVRNSFGQKLTMLFKNDRLIGQIIHNYIP